MLWSRQTHALKTSASGDDYPCRGTATRAGPGFRPSHRDRAQAPRNTTRRILQGRTRRVLGGCWAALCSGDCPECPSCSSGLSLFRRAISLLSAGMSARQRRDLVPATIARPYNIRTNVAKMVGLYTFQRLLLPRPTKKSPYVRIRPCAANRSIQCSL